MPHALSTSHADAGAADRVAVVIVNYNTPGLVIDCLKSLADERSRGERFRVVVADNASPDGSARVLEAAVRDHGWGDWATVLPLAANGGFAAGNNAALRPLLAAAHPPEYVLLLNPDTVARPGAVGELVKFLDAHPRAGLAGSRLEHPDGTPQRSAFRFPTVLGEFEYGMRLGPVSRLLSRYVVAPPVRDAAHPADWLSGASLMVRRPVFADVGLLDDGFFLYFEETDFCRRAAAAGWGCWYVPASRVVHLVGQATGVAAADRPAKRLPGYWWAARRRYFRKSHGRVGAALADAAFAVGYSLWRVRRRLQRKPDRDPPHLLADFVRFQLGRR